MLSVFLINLDGSSERLKKASEQLRRAGIDFERVPAFDGRTVDMYKQEDLDQAACLRFIGRPLKGGEYGCYKSHLECARRIVDKKLDFAVVLEDDIELLPNVSSILSEIVETLESKELECDVVHLSADRIKYSTALSKLGQSNSLVSANYFPMTTSALLWTYAGAKRFVEKSSVVTMPVDHQLRETYSRSGRGYAVWPAIARQSGDSSDIDQGDRQRNLDGRRWNYGLLKQRRLLTNKVYAMGRQAFLRFRGAKSI